MLEAVKCIIPASIPQRSRDWSRVADTDSIDEEAGVNSADLLGGVVRSELEALSAGIDYFPCELSCVLHSRIVCTTGECSDGIISCS